MVNITCLLIRIRCAEALLPSDQPGVHGYVDDKLVFLQNYRSYTVPRLYLQKVCNYREGPTKDIIFCLFVKTVNFPIWISL